MTVYFAADQLRIKVGYTGRLAERRLADINSTLIEPLALLGTIEGDRAVERAAHVALKEFHITREWFVNSNPARSKVNDILLRGAACLDVQRKPPPLVIAFEQQKPTKPVIPTLARMMWPDDAIAELSALSGHPESDCRQWMEGTAEIPRLIRLAFATVMLQWTFGKPMTFRDPEAETFFA